MIAHKTWRELWPIALLYYMVMQVMILPPIMLWPELAQDLKGAGVLGRLVRGWLPDFLKSFLGAPEPEAFRMFTALQVFFRAANLCGVAAAVLIGTGLIAKERETLTLEFLLSRPVSRSRVLWSKVWICSLLLVVPVFLSAASCIFIAPWAGHQLALAPLLVCAAHASCFLLAIFALTVLASVLCHSQLGAAAAVGMFVVVQASIYFVQRIRRFSIFQLSDFDVYGPIMTGQGSSWDMFLGYTIWLIAAILLLYLLADRAFRRSEL